MIGTMLNITEKNSNPIIALPLIILGSEESLEKFPPKKTHAFQRGQIQSWDNLT
jgi:hypothetical protein